MAILKLYNGSKQQLDSTAKEAGSVYILEDGSFWFDYLDTSSNVQRNQLTGGGLKYVDFLPMQGEQGFVYVVPKLLYVDIHSLNSVVNEPGSVSIHFNTPTPNQVSAGEYKVYIRDTITYNNAQSWDIVWQGDFIGTSTYYGSDVVNEQELIRNVKDFGSAWIDFSGLSDELNTNFSEGTIKGDIAFIIEEPGERKYLKYIWLDNKWESLTDKTELASKDYVTDTITQRTLPLCTKITEHLNIDQYTFEDRDAENIVRIDKLGSSSSYSEPDNDVQITSVGWDSCSGDMNEPEVEQLDQNTIKITASTYSSNYGSCSVRCNINQISDKRYYDFKIISAPLGTLKNETVYGYVEHYWMETEPELEYDEETDQWIETGEVYTYEMSGTEQIPNTVEPELYVNAFVIGVNEPGEYIIQLYATTAESIAPTIIKSKPLSILTKDSVGNVLSNVSLSETLLAKCPRLDEGFNNEIYNYIDFINRQYIEVGKYIDETWITYTQPVVVDLSTEITEDILLKTAVHGTIEIISTTSAKCPVDLTFFRATGAVIDKELSATSTNTIQNAVVTAELTDLRAKINDLASQLDQVEALLDKVINGGV